MRPGRRLIEPFVGSGAVFLNTSYSSYLLADTNPDLINLYKQLNEEGQSFIDYCATLFKRTNNKTQYYRLREEFNHTDDTRRKSSLLLYLNRHCYNGLVRYNSSGKFNTPFGRYKKPYFPEPEMQRFIQASSWAEFLHMDFQQCMQLAGEGDVVYCDPPYIPLTSTANFTNYHTYGFDWDEQLKLIQHAKDLANRNVQVVISNHDLPLTRKLYKQAGAKIIKFQVKRTISTDINNRKQVGELLAVFE